jgi:hypothetical protein
VGAAAHGGLARPAPDPLPGLPLPRRPPALRGRGRAALAVSIGGRAFLEYLDHLQRLAPDQLGTIILPEFVPARSWQHLLHHQAALRIKGALLFRKGVVASSVPIT